MTRALDAPLDAASLVAACCRAKSGTGGMEVSNDEDVCGSLPLIAAPYLVQSGQERRIPELIQGAG